MGNYDSGRASDFGGINIELRRADSLNGIRFDSNRSDPSSANDVILYRGSGSSLRFWDGSSATTLGSAGGLVNFSLNDGYDDGRTITVDAGAVTLNGVNMDTATLALNADAGSAGPVVLFTNAGSGNDITGTASAWSVSVLGAAAFLSVATDLISSAGATDLVLETNAGTNSSTITITDAANGAITCAMNGTGKFVISGTTEANTGFQLTNGDAVISDGSLSITDDDNAAALTVTTTGTSNALTIVADGVTGGNVVDINADGLTTGNILHLDSSVAGWSGYFIDCYNGASTVFSIGVDGAVVVAGTATGTDALTLTAGDFKVSDGATFITQSANAAALTIVADANAGNIVIDVNADGVTTGTLLHLDSSSAGFSGKYIQCYDGAADDFSVGADGATVITTSAAGTVGLTVTHGGTTGDAMQITCSALTTGDALQISQTAETFAAGELLKIVNTENGDISATPKTGNLASITSSVTMTTESASLDYDTLLISRSDIANQGTKTLTAAGSVLKLMLTATNTAGTCTDSVKGLEIVMADGGTAAPTGTALDIISVGVAAKAINIASASTTVSDVLIAGSGVKANTKAVVEVTSTGATAAGGALLRVAHAGTGDPAAATSYIAYFSQASATCANNPVAVYIDSGASTASGLQVTGSGVMAGGTISAINTNAGALGAVIKLDHQSASPANADVIGRITFFGKDSGAASQEYARIDAVITDTTAASEDGDLTFSVFRAGTLTQQLALDSDINGVVLGDGATASTITSNGSYDLTLSTASTAANEPKIVLTDGAAGNITITAGGTSGKIAVVSPIVLTAQAIVNANTAINVTTPLTTIANNGASTHTMADGVVGQTKTIVCTVYTADAVITPSNFVGTTITLNAAGDSWTGIFLGTEWVTTALGGTAAVA